MSNQNNTVQPFTYTITFSIPAKVVEPVFEIEETEEEEYWSIEDYVAVAGDIMAELDRVNTTQRPELIKPTNKAYTRCLDVMAVAAAWLHKNSAKQLKSKEDE
jgi:glycine cleavage system protein P-like pyridoxal-binding family